MPTKSALDLAAIRAQYPSLSQTVNGQPAVFFDGPGGTQVPEPVAHAVADTLTSPIANRGRVTAA